MLAIESQDGTVYTFGPGARFSIQPLGPRPNGEGPDLQLFGLVGHEGQQGFILVQGEHPSVEAAMRTFKRLLAAGPIRFIGHDELVTAKQA